MMPPPSSESARLQLLLLQLLVPACLMVIMIFGLIVFFIGDVRWLPSPTAVVAVVVVNLVAFVVAELVGYRTPALRPDTPRAQALRTGMTWLHISTVVRLVITGAPVLVSLITKFVLDPGPWTFYIGSFVAALCLIWHGWPSSRVIRRIERSLDRAGGRSDLSELLSTTPSPVPRTTP